MHTYTIDPRDQKYNTLDQIIDNPQFFRCYKPAIDHYNEIHNEDFKFYWLCEDVLYGSYLDGDMAAIFEIQI